MKRLFKASLSATVFQRLTEIERFQGQWDGGQNKLLPTVVQELKKTTIITSSGASTRIEGSVLSDVEVSQLIERGCRITRMSSRSEREVAGYVNTLKYVRAHFREMRVTEHEIKSLHSLMTRDFLEEQLPSKQRGAYKDVPNDVVEKNNETGEEKIWFKTAPAGPQTSAAMRDLIDGFRAADKNGEQAMLGIGGFVVLFLAIHPFRDGNGRLSRLVTHWLMLRAGYDWFQYSSHEKFIEDNKEAYYVALRATQKTLEKQRPDFNPWLEYFLLVLGKQTEYLRSKMVAASPISALNENEAQVYQVVLEHGVCNISFIEKHVRMSRDGLKDLLARLVQKGILARLGKKKETVYRVAS